jgi:hypothetical protein
MHNTLNSKYRSTSYVLRYISEVLQKACKHIRGTDAARAPCYSMFAAGARKGDRAAACTI